MIEKLFQLTKDAIKPVEEMDSIIEKMSKADEIDASSSKIEYSVTIDMLDKEYERQSFNIGDELYIDDEYGRRKVYVKDIKSNGDIELTNENQNEKEENMKMFVTTYTFDSGVTLAKQSIVYEYPEYGLGEDVTYELFLDNKMQTKKGVVVKVSQEIKEMDECFKLLIK